MLKKLFRQSGPSAEPKNEPTPHHPYEPEVPKGPVQKWAVVPQAFYGMTSAEIYSHVITFNMVNGEKIVIEVSDTVHRDSWDYCLVSGQRVCEGQEAIIKGTVRQVYCSSFSLNAIDHCKETYLYRKDDYTTLTIMKKNINTIEWCKKPIETIEICMDKLISIEAGSGGCGG